MNLVSGLGTWNALYYESRANRKCKPRPRNRINRQNVCVLQIFFSSVSLKQTRVKTPFLYEIIFNNLRYTHPKS